MKPTTVLVWAETPTNPMLKVVASRDWPNRALAQRTPRGGQHVHEPVFSEAAGSRRDIVLHSGTKYLNGHSDVVCGFLVVNDKASG